MAPDLEKDLVRAWEIVCFGNDSEGNEIAERPSKYKKGDPILVIVQSFADGFQRVACPFYDPSNQNCSLAESYEDTEKGKCPYILGPRST